MLAAITDAGGTTVQVPPAVPPPVTTPAAPPVVTTAAAPAPSPTPAASTADVDVGYIRGSAGLVQQYVDTSTGQPVGSPVPVGAPPPPPSTNEPTTTTTTTPTTDGGDGDAVEDTSLQAYRPAGLLLQWENVLDTLATTAPKQASEISNIYADPKEFFK